jgi:hypothetical protein
MGDGGMAFPPTSQPPASLDGKNRQSHLQLLHSFNDGFPRRWVFVRFLPEPVQDSVCLGDVLDRFCVLPLLSCRRFVGRHICLLWPAVRSLDQCRFYAARASNCFRSSTIEPGDAVCQ